MDGENTSDNSENKSQTSSSFHNKVQFVVANPKKLRQAKANAVILTLNVFALMTVVVIFAVETDEVFAAAVLKGKTDFKDSIRQE